MNDGDFVETSHRSLAGDTITHCPSTRANRGDASTVGHQRHFISSSLLHSDANTVAQKSTRTHRHHLVDGKPLLKRQAAAVWNRPSIAKPRMLPYHHHTSLSTVSSLSLNSLESFPSFNNLLDEECNSDETSSSSSVASLQEEQKSRQEMADMNDTSSETRSIVQESRKTDGQCEE